MKERSSEYLAALARFRLAESHWRAADRFYGQGKITTQELIDAGRIVEAAEKKLAEVAP